MEELQADKLAEHTRQAFDYEHSVQERSDLCDFVPARVEELLLDVGLPRDWFKGKEVLDAGCGGGRWSYAMAELGAKVTAFDFTMSGVKAANNVLWKYDDCSAFFADITRADKIFRHDRYDLVFSWGVLHHTEKPQENFARLTKLAKPGGYLYVMVYGTTNPIQDATTNIVRAVMRHMTPEQRYEACKELVLPDPRLYRVLWPYLYVYSGTPGTSEYERQLFAAYDCYSPAWNYRYSMPEVAQWFLDAGFSEIKFTRIVDGANHIRGRKPLCP